MTAQEAAHKLLTESKNPMTAMVIASLALDRHLVTSYAKKKAYSVAQTIEKNVRDGTYNNPKLKFVFSKSGTRMLALPEWKGEPRSDRVSATPAVAVELTAQIPADLLEQVRLALQAKIAEGLDSTVVLLLRRGLVAEAPNIREGLMKQLSQLNKSDKNVS